MAAVPAEFQTVEDVRATLTDAEAYRVLAERQMMERWERELGPRPETVDLRVVLPVARQLVPTKADEDRVARAASRAVHDALLAELRTK